MHHSMSELRLDPLQYAKIGNICAACYHVRRQEDDRDLATFGINAVCFLFFQALTLSHYIHLTQWGRSGILLRVHATRHQALNSISVFNPVNGRERKERQREREEQRCCHVDRCSSTTSSERSHKIQNCNRHGERCTVVTGLKYNEVPI